MAIFTNPANASGNSVLVWQTTDAIYFQFVQSNGVPIGTPMTVENGSSAWVSAAPLGTDGGFTIFWDGSANAAPLAQDYDASGAAIGAPYTPSGSLPIEPVATTSLEMPVAQDPNNGPWTALLPNGDTVAVTGQDFNGPGAPQLLFQQFDPAGNEVGQDYVGTYQGLPGLGNIQTSALSNGDYVVTFTDNQNYGGQLFYELFRADGTHLASDAVASAGFQLIPDHATAALPDGGFLMTWVAAEYNSQDLSNPAPYAVFAQEFDAHGTAVTSQKMLAVLPSDNQFTAPQIVDFGSGVPTVSWTADGAPQSASFSEHGTLVSHTNDTIFTPAASYTLPDGPHNIVLAGSTAQTITGNNLGDTITSNDAASTLIGGSGNDTLIAGHNANVMTGGGGADIFSFPVLPWNAGHITDFTVGTDHLDLSALFSASGYTGTDPVADGYLQFASDGSGGTKVYYDSDGPGGSQWPTFITTLDHVSPGGLTAADVLGTASSGGGGGGGTGGGTSGETLTADDSPNQQLTGGAGDDTFYAGHNSVVMTGNGGADDFIFNYLPWNAGHITDFTPGTDTMDFSALFQSTGYTGTNPVADGYLNFVSDGSGNTKVYFDADGPNGNQWPTLVTTLDHIQPSQIQTSDWIFHH